MNLICLQNLSITKKEGPRINGVLEGITFNKN
jgi:hypothetical protein